MNNIYIVRSWLFCALALGNSSVRAASDSTSPSQSSRLEVYNLDTQRANTVLAAPERMESPHFSREGRALYFNRGGQIYRFVLGAAESPRLIDTGFARHCNNDHGLSPDGTQLVFGDVTESGKGQIYIMPTAGGAPRRIPVDPPAYWHGWSPDGKTLLYCAARAGNYDVYSISVSGSQETRLTRAPENDNGPDYSADGNLIYFHSERSGRMQIWRMRNDGSQPEPVTSDSYYNWFPHPSPDGRWILVLSSRATPTTGHPPDGEYILRLLSTQDRSSQELLHFRGGNGSLNVPCWSPDSRSIAFAAFGDRS